MRCGILVLWPISKGFIPYMFMLIVVASVNDDDSLAVVEDDDVN